MIHFRAPFIVFAVALSAATARFLEADLSLGTVSEGRTLGARQSTVNIPSECAPTCGNINTVISNGCTPMQCCTSQFEMQYFNCFLCVGASVNLTDYSIPQESIDGLVAQCMSRGLTIPKLTFPNATSSSTTALSSSSSRSVSRNATSSTLQNTVTSTSPPFIPTPTISQSTITFIPSTSDPAPAQTSGSSASKTYDLSWIGMGIAGYLIAGWHPGGW